ncbi:phosphatidylserine decarboxylase-domain-containing protein [Cokeromyces recurvatus]|uniref:phosphatidylserine decarboxylase-domain-containing protein n=1 Tax=Cokeromyces recurvatus TaxID=90255 RepID=UPI00221FA4F3|nr:phosphatidylserine decarboxylase-domain-containing protein [Cokeromyces recurvatus]KAI7898117.1 phosphatidylserine decarboxylase-domain-containing protein [Cokeromyces recurvatus]
MIRPNWQTFHCTNNQKKTTNNNMKTTKRRAFSESTDFNDNNNYQRFKQIWKLLSPLHQHHPHHDQSQASSTKSLSITKIVNSNQFRISSSLPSEIEFNMIPDNDNHDSNYDNKSYIDHLRRHDAIVMPSTNDNNEKEGSRNKSFSNEHGDIITKPNLRTKSLSDTTTTLPTLSSSTSSSSFKSRLVTKRYNRRKKAGIEGKFHKDVIGVTFLEICHAKDLPPERNLTRTSFDMDPFVVVSYGTSSFRTSAVRHNLNPVWNEKLFFHVRHHETKFHLKFTVYDREKFSGNDLVAWCQVPLQDIIFNNNKDKESNDMDLHTFPLQMANFDKWKHKRRPTLTIRAKFMPYDQIRKMFWIALARTYDVNNTGSLTKLEVQSMLETIGSTISESTIDSFWIKRGMDPNKEDNNKLTLDQLVESLEDHMRSDDDEIFETSVVVTPDSYKQGIKTDDDDDDDELLEDIQAGIVNTSIGIEEEKIEKEDEDEDEEEYEEDDDYDDEWAQNNDCDNDDIIEDMERVMTLDEEDNQLVYTIPNSVLFDYSSSLMPSIMEPNLDLGEVLIKEGDKNRMLNSLDSTIPKSNNNKSSDIPSLQQPFLASSTNTLSSARRRRGTEKVIRLKECPICHRPNLSRKTQMDIITHVATCAANDWTTVDRFLMGNFLTEAYAQRRWFVKLVRIVGYGRYSLGKANANIIVQDRRTGQLIEEKMLVHVRLGMRLVYKGMKTGIQSRGAQRILTNLTIRQGRNYDSPNSAKEIPAFIKFHNIQLHEVWKPVSSFKTFNEFFYRKLRPGSRPVDSPDDPTVAVSPADSRMTAFESVTEATRLWIKGLDFSLKKLLGNSSSNAEIFERGSLAIFRLAPQDYHRFHSPVDGVITRIKHISGQYYTVNPMAIRTTIDVFGENTRTIIWMDSEEFGQVAIVCVGAMLVGSIIITAKVGSKLKRTDELGYFAFGGSTLITVFQKGKISFDSDLLDNSDKALETLVQVGNHIGVLPLQ